MSPEEQSPAAVAEVRPFVDRLIGAARLDPAVYDDVALDPAATNQAAVVVALSALAQALGGPEPIPVGELPVALAWAYFSWLAPGSLVWLVGTRLLGHESDLPRVLRCVGFATAPQVLWLVGLLPLDAAPFHVALGILVFSLSLVANVIGIRQAFGVATRRAAMIFALGFVAFALLAVVVGSLVVGFGGPGGPSVGPP